MFYKVQATGSDHFNYIEQLTWLRGFAAFVVIVSHTIAATEVAYGVADVGGRFAPLGLLDLGTFGVILFFVLSGSTLAISNAQKMRASNVHAFYIKRFFRIWPAFVVSLICYMAFRVLFAEYYTVQPAGYWVEGQFLRSYAFGDVVNYVLLIFNFTGPEGLFNNAYWSLPVEFQYYLIFPILILSLKYLSILGPLAIGVLLYALPRTGLVDGVGNVFFNLAFVFCGGVIVGDLYMRSQWRIKLEYGVSLFVALLLLAIAVRHDVVPLPDLPLVSNRWNVFGLIGTVMVFVVLFTRFSMQGRFKAFLKHYGTISYSTYLYHNLFVGSSVLLIINLGIHTPSTRILLTAALAILGSYVAAVLSYKYVEKPSIALGRKFAKRSLSVAKTPASGRLGSDET